MGAKNNHESTKTAKVQRELIRSRKVDYEENLKIFEALYREAISLGVLPLKDPLEGLEVDIMMARVINGVLGAS